jgi:adenine phosphoribosyltransferase
MFRDITTLLQDPQGFAMVIDGLAEHYKNQPIDKIAGIEARGFIIGAALAYKLGVGFVPVRKIGKLPAETISQEYALEYGIDHLEIHTDAIRADEQVLLIDDLIATGGTAEAASALIQQLGGVVMGCGFVIDLPDLGGMQRLQNLGLATFSLCAFEGE